MIVASHLTRQFGDRVAVEDLTFEVRAGEIVGLLGPNGAGKTTTLRMLGGLIAPTSGTAIVGGIPLSRGTAGRIRAQVGFLTEVPGLWDRLTVRTNLFVYARLYGTPDPEAAVRHALERFELADRAESRTAELSKGMKQKLALARALIHDPPIVLLDEPTAGLDPQTARRVRELVLHLRRNGRAIIVSSHNLDEIERIADRVGMLQQRLVAFDTPARLRQRLFGRRIRVTLAGEGAEYARLVAVAGATDVRAERHTLSMAVADPDAETPALVRALVEAGAAIRAVAREEPPLEEVYLRVMDGVGARETTGNNRASIGENSMGAQDLPIQPPIADRRPLTLMSPLRVRALLAKEFAEHRRNWLTWVPTLLTAAFSVALPFALALGLPLVTGDRLSADPDFQHAIEGSIRHLPALRALDPEAAAQAFLFQQFLLFLLLIPVVGSMALAAASVVGEKQGRTLEPLLATPITVGELLLGKVTAAIVPSLALTGLALLVYATGVWALAAPGVFRALLSLQTLVIVLGLGPPAALVALQLAVLVSSRVNDARTAQQIGALVILPLTGLVVSQFAGAFFMTTAVSLALGAGLLAMWLVLVCLSVALFDRETILTRWK